MTVGELIRFGDYVLHERLGYGYEGEVYLATERSTGLHRAVKILRPLRGRHENKHVRWLARKTHKLRDCSIVLHYYHRIKGLIDGDIRQGYVSELVEGETVKSMLGRKRVLPLYAAISLCYELVCGVEEIHGLGEYHGDIHYENVMLMRRGVSFRPRLIDFYDHGRPNQARRQLDIVDIIRMLIWTLGGRAKLRQQIEPIRYLCGGNRRDVILHRFPSLGHLRTYLETFEWPT